jgi:hypothetical protein
MRQALHVAIEKSKIGAWGQRSRDVIDGGVGTRRDLPAGTARLMPDDDPRDGPPE